jgi:hypothetical protein
MLKGCAVVWLVVAGLCRIRSTRKFHGIPRSNWAFVLKFLGRGETDARNCLGPRSRKFGAPWKSHVKNMQYMNLRLSEYISFKKGPKKGTNISSQLT